MSVTSNGEAIDDEQNEDKRGEADGQTCVHRGGTGFRVPAPAACLSVLLAGGVCGHGKE